MQGRRKGFRKYYERVRGSVSFRHRVQCDVCLSERERTAWTRHVLFVSSPSVALGQHDGDESFDFSYIFLNNLRSEDFAWKSAAFFTNAEVTNRHEINILCSSSITPSGVRRKFSWGVFIQWHMVVICIWCPLFVMSKFDVIFLFPNQTFGEVCWHNMLIRLHALP